MLSSFEVSSLCLRYQLIHKIHFVPTFCFLLYNYILAINICFGEKQIYTQEVLAVVIQQLMDITPLPTLFMRTVSASLFILLNYKISDNLTFG